MPVRVQVVFSNFSFFSLTLSLLLFTHCLICYLCVGTYIFAVTNSVPWSGSVKNGTDELEGENVHKWETKC